MREMEELAGRDQEAADACDMKTEGGKSIQSEVTSKRRTPEDGKAIGGSRGEGQSRTKHDTYI